MTSARGKSSKPNIGALAPWKNGSPKNVFDEEPLVTFAEGRGKSLKVGAPMSKVSNVYNYNLSDAHTPTAAASKTLPGKRTLNTISTAANTAASSNYNYKNDEDEDDDIDGIGTM